VQPLFLYGEVASSTTLFLCKKKNIKYLKWEVIKPRSAQQGKEKTHENHRKCLLGHNENPIINKENREKGEQPNLKKGLQPSQPQSPMKGKKKRNQVRGGEKKHEALL